MNVPSCQSFAAEGTDVNGSSWGADMHHVDELIRFGQPALYGDGE